MDDLIALIEQTIKDEAEQLWTNLPIPEGLVNRETGLPPTQTEWEQIKARAQEILDDPYAAPEVVAWAIDICPTGILVPFEGQLWRKFKRGGSAG